MALNDEPIKSPEQVDHPAHYNAGGIECIDALEAALSPEEFIGFLRGNVIKYMWRARDKGGFTDLAKAEWYNDRLKTFISQNDNEQLSIFLRASDDLDKPLLHRRIRDAFSYAVRNVSNVLEGADEDEALWKQYLRDTGYVPPAL